jgi:hypothetical protein
VLPPGFLRIFSEITYDSIGKSTIFLRITHLTREVFYSGQPIGILVLLASGPPVAAPDAGGPPVAAPDAGGPPVAAPDWRGRVRGWMTSLVPTTSVNDAAPAPTLFR